MVQVQILIEVILWKMKEALSRDSKVTKKVILRCIAPISFGNFL